MDGVDQLNNILLIGMTNRLDMIDDALLRPGRLEVHMEISLPDEKGRYQILNIHTSKMRTNGVMDSDVDLVELASLTKNFSGAEIGGLVKSATSFAFNRHVKVSTWTCWIKSSNFLQNRLAQWQEFPTTWRIFVSTGKISLALLTKCSPRSVSLRRSCSRLFKTVSSTLTDPSM